VSPRSLIVIGIVWFLGAATFAVRFAQTSFAIGWIVKGPISNATSLAGIYFVFVFTIVFLIGWTVPISIGVYRLLRH
jgi:hypothetical protein